jgi:hypothetical protein
VFGFSRLAAGVIREGKASHGSGCYDKLVDALLKILYTCTLKFPTAAMEAKKMKVKSKPYSTRS